MKKIIAISILSIALLIGCSPETTTEIIEKFDDGTKKVEETFYISNGEKVVVFKTFYHENGMKEKEGPIENGKRTGKWTAWFDNGTLWSEGSFLDGKSEGEFLVYSESGSLFMKSSYKNGIPDGTWTIYDEANKTTKEIIYKEGKVISEKDNLQDFPAK